jgi:hypothetical protein
MPESLLALTPAELRRVQELVAALRVPVCVEVSPGSQWMTPGFVEEFTSRLLAQHIFLGSPLQQDAFDRAFMSSARHVGGDVVEAPSGQRFWDMKWNGMSLSLKTTSAKGLRKDVLHVSKLTEAAWIQDCRTATARRNKTIELFRNYVAAVDSILQFRYFVNEGLYELVEIPCPLLLGVLTAGLADFKAEGPSINIPIGKNPPDFTLKLDRSDAKITLANIRKDRCILHASWRLPARTQSV